MSRETKDFDITKLLDLAGKSKYEITVAGFEVIDNLDIIEVPRKMSNRKPAIQALYTLSESNVNFGFVSDEQREQLAEEFAAKAQQHRPSFNDNFKNAGGAPVTDDSEEDLQEDVETFEDVFIDDSEASEESDWDNEDKLAEATVGSEDSEEEDSDEDDSTDEIEESNDMV